MADLGKVMLTPKGAYSSVTRYERLDLVEYKGSSYIALRDVSGTAPESDDGTNWQLHGQGFPGNAEGVEVTDTSGIIVGAGGKTDVQALLDEVADRVLNVSGAAADITAVDTSGLIGLAGGISNTQALLDIIADKVATKLLLKTDVISQIVNDQNKAASAAAVYAMQEQLDQVNSDLKQTCSGRYSGVGIPNNTRVIITITFPVPFKRPPNVIACTSYGTGLPQLVSVDVALATETQVEIMCWQNMGATVPASFYWFATE